MQAQSRTQEPKVLTGIDLFFFSFFFFFFLVSEHSMVNTEIHAYEAFIK